MGLAVAPCSAEPIAVVVPASLLPPPGVDTGVNLVAGQQLTITATGLATHDGGNQQTDPDGMHYSNGVPVGQYYAADAFIPSAHVGALIGRVGEGGNWFEIGSNLSFSAPSTGRLFLAYNDGPWGYYDNFGSYTATVTVVPTYSVNPLFDQTKAVKSGSTIPIKLQVLDSNGLNASSSGLVLNAQRLEWISTQTLTEVGYSDNANADTNFRYDSTLGETGGYIYNLQTTGLASGQYRLSFTIGGGSTLYSVEFFVK
jgi:hypothetical protein